MNLGKQTDCLEYLEMCKKRKVFKHQLRQCRKDCDDNRFNAMTADIFGNDFQSFWQKVKNDSKVVNNCSNIIDGNKGKECIASFWAAHYANLFSLANLDEPDDKNYLYKKFDSADRKLSVPFPCNDLLVAASKLKLKKSTGPDCLQAEHFKYSPIVVFNLLTRVLNACVCDSFLPHEILAVSITPIVEKKGLNACSSNSYRPIAIATTISKLIEHVILCKYERELKVGVWQFGYKKSWARKWVFFHSKVILDTIIIITQLYTLASLMRLKLSIMCCMKNYALSYVKEMYLF